MREAAATKALLTPASGFNHRQIALLSHATRHPGAAYTFTSHGRSHGVAYATARADLLDLVGRGLLDQIKQGKKFVFLSPSDLSMRLHMHDLF
jgi:Fic family protein